MVLETLKIQNLRENQDSVCFRKHLTMQAWWVFYTICILRWEFKIDPGKKCSYEKGKQILSKDRKYSGLVLNNDTTIIVDDRNVDFEMLVILRHFLKHKYLDALKRIVINYTFHLIVLMKTNRLLVPSAI